MAAFAENQNPDEEQQPVEEHEPIENQKPVEVQCQDPPIENLESYVEQESSEWERVSDFEQERVGNQLIEDKQAHGTGNDKQQIASAEVSLDAMLEMSDRKLNKVIDEM